MNVPLDAISQLAYASRCPLDRNAEGVVRYAAEALKSQRLELDSLRHAARSAARYLRASSSLAHHSTALAELERAL